MAMLQAMGVSRAPTEAGDADWPHPPALAAPADPAPHGARPDTVRAWFDVATEADIPTPDGTLATAQAIAAVLARRTYRAGVRAWCAWCTTHDLTPLPARPADVAAFLAAQRYVAPGTDEKPLAAEAAARRHRLSALPRRPPLPHNHGRRDGDLCRSAPGRHPARDRRRDPRQPPRPA